MRPSKIILPLLISIGGLFGPILCVYLQISHPVRYGWAFVVFIVAHGLFRLWESFFTSKDHDRLTVEHDWTLTLTTVVYTGFCYLIILEFFFVRKSYNFFIAGTGLMLYGFAYYLRWWGMRTLGSQWSIHAVGEKKVKRTHFLQIGPYRYTRHPIYLSILIDQIALILITNTFYASFYFALISFPAYWLRISYEEKSNISKFGQKYLDYRSKVGILIPPKMKL